ncbi:PIN domain-containing protein [Schaalia naturae]|uniref:PIN domain-containing protein n=1 Tax=Schaalia naturae TaxID=635203 RepID=A0ABW2SJ38_9ACTO
MTARTPLAVVFDVNVYLNFILGADGAYPPILDEVPPTSGNSSADSLSLALDGSFALYSSPHIACTVKDGMQRCGQSQRLIGKYLELLVDIWETSGGRVVEPVVRDFGLEDFEDNNILALALDPSVQAAIVVSSDHHLLDIGPNWRGTWICRPREFVHALIGRRV